MPATCSPPHASLRCGAYSVRQARVPRAPPSTRAQRPQPALQPSTRPKRLNMCAMATSPLSAEPDWSPAPMHMTARRQRPPVRRAPLTGWKPGTTGQLPRPGRRMQHGAPSDDKLPRFARGKRRFARARPEQGNCETVCHSPTTIASVAKPSGKAGYSPGTAERPTLQTT